MLEAIETPLVLGLAGSRGYGEKYQSDGRPAMVIVLEGISNGWGRYGHQRWVDVTKDCKAMRGVLRSNGEGAATNRGDTLRRGSQGC